MDERIAQLRLWIIQNRDEWYAATGIGGNNAKFTLRVDMINHMFKTGQYELALAYLYRSYEQNGEFRNRVFQYFLNKALYNNTGANDSFSKMMDIFENSSKTTKKDI